MSFAGRISLISPRVQRAFSLSMSTVARADKAKAEGPIEKIMRTRLTEKYAPAKLVIENESHKHRHHAPMQGVESTETHFRVKIISEGFRGQPLIKRQREVYGLFKEEMKMDGGIHALTLVTKTPEEAAK